jgi:hypothetical protein
MKQPKSGGNFEWRGRVEKEGQGAAFQMLITLTDPAHNSHTATVRIHLSESK